VIGKGKPKRILKLDSEQTAEVWTQKLECPAHGGFRACPPVAVPRKHYAARVIDEVVAASSSGESVTSICSRLHLPDERTPRRWIFGLLQRLNPLKLRVARQLTSLDPTAQADKPPNRRPLAELWHLLGQLQEACRRRGLCPPSRAFLAFCS